MDIPPDMDLDDPGTPERLGLWMLADDGALMRPPSVIAWARWYGTADRVVEQTKIGAYMVSTVFLALDAFPGLRVRDRARRPILWETLVFDRHGAPHPDYSGRYRSAAEAREGHAEICRTVRKRL